jgi:hypothetical protein
MIAGHPSLDVWGLPPHELCYQACYTADFHFYEVMKTLCDSANRAWSLALWNDLKVTSRGFGVAARYVGECDTDSMSEYGRVSDALKVLGS